MTPATQILTNLLAGLALLGLVSTALGTILAWRFWRAPERLPGRALAARWALPAALLVAFAGTIGSLFYSEVVGFAPCPLCWYQRIFLYPEVVVLAVALITRDKKFYRYSLPLAVLGGGVALYHHLIQTGWVVAGGCAVGGVSCAARYIFAFDFVTLPLISLAAFGLIMVLSVWSKLAAMEPKKN